MQLMKEKEKLTKLKRETGNSIAKAGDVNIPFSIINRTTREKMSKKIE